MKKIINGRMYDTNTANGVGEWESSYGYTDFHWYQEKLFRKRTGEYFLYGEGNAASPYRRAVEQNCWTGSEDIKPLTVEEARIWAEEHLTADEYETEFGEVSEDESRMAICITLPRSMVEQIKREAAKADISMSAFIESKIVF